MKAFETLKDSGMEKRFHSLIPAEGDPRRPATSSLTDL